jgi:hypothetical protein
MLLMTVVGAAVGVLVSVELVRTGGVRPPAPDEKRASELRAGAHTDRKRPRCTGNRRVSVRSCARWSGSFVVEI